MISIQQKNFAWILILFLLAVVVVGCQTNDDCPQTEACNNRDCVDPCNCGTNAQCYVRDHKPVCYCPVGFTGNPEVGCVPGEHTEVNQYDYSEAEREVIERSKCKFLRKSVLHNFELNHL